MLAHRTATGLTIALLALPATATATPLTDDSGGGAAPALSSSRPYSFYNGWPGDPDHRTGLHTSSLAGTTSSQTLVSPDAADAARAGDIAKAMEHYERSQPAPAAAKPASHTGDDPAWPEIAFAGIVVLATAGGLVRVRMHRTRRIAA
jgi:hypothetical protein